MQREGANHRLFVRYLFETAGESHEKSGKQIDAKTSMA
jgi:hypothetical protein